MGKVIGDTLAPRTPQGQPDIAVELVCEHCGKTSKIVMTWEGARQFAAHLEQRIAEAMRDVPRDDRPTFGVWPA